MNYQKLVSDCKEIITEFGFTHRWSLIELNWALGKRIVAEHNGMEREDIYGKKIVSRLAESLENWSERKIYRAVQFYKKYPDLNMLPVGKNISWHKVVQKYLPETTTEEKPTYIECPQCHFKWEK